MSRWTGEWVSRRLGVEVTAAASKGLPGCAVDDLVGLAVRRNPKRAHLLVSTVLGKHVPTDPRRVYGAGLQLGGLVRERLGIGAPAAVVVGFAETATALGHAVADALGDAACIHSTRRAVPGLPAWGDFTEEHSHAPDHLLLPQDPLLLSTGAPLVLVDDELSTGRTACNTIAAAHRLAPRDRYVIASLVDVREPADRQRLAEFAADLGVRVDVVALAHGRVRLPVDVLARGAALVAELDGGPQPDGVARPVGDRHGTVRRVDVPWPADAIETGRHGFLPTDRARLVEPLSAVAQELARQWAARQCSGRILVLGTEELMYAPLRLAVALADLVDPAGCQAGLAAATRVFFSSTTRSPVLAVDDPGYAVRHALGFVAPEPPHEVRAAYNIAPGAFDLVVAVLDEPADTDRLTAPGGLVAALAAVCDEVAVVVLPDAAADRARRLRRPRRLAGVR